MKINVTDKDYRWNGLGFNDYNFIKNVTPRISQWLLEIYNKATVDDHEIANKLERICQIIDEE